LHGEGVLVNAHMDAALLRRHLRLDEDAERLLAGAQRRGALSARGQHRVLRVARTLADLAGDDRVGARALADALSLRTEAALDGHRGERVTAQRRRERQITCPRCSTSRSYRPSPLEEHAARSRASASRRRS
jgi:Mg-chelatase subunit ChlI